MFNVFPTRSICFVCLILAALLILPQTREAGAAVPADLKYTQVDWVCVTDEALVPAYEVLAEHRRGQGLTSIVISLAEAVRWSPYDDDTVKTLHWLASIASQHWGAQYLMLGGSHQTLPAPLHRWESGETIVDSPCDAYFACLDGEWDVNGDGFVAEWEVDAADPSVHLRVGRAPADDAETAANFVAKILAFEQRIDRAEAGAFFVSSHMRHPYHGIPEEFSASVEYARNLRELALTGDSDLRAGTLFQGLANEFNPLYEQALVDSLGARAHDFAFFQLKGTTDLWDLGTPPNIITAQAFDPLRDSGHAFLFSMISGDVGDTRGPNLIQHLMDIRDGGAVAAIVPSGIAFYFYMLQFQEALWPRLTGRTIQRFGDAHVATLEAYRDEYGLTNRGWATTYWYLTLFGDPATLIRPEGSDVSETPSAADRAGVRAIPNPFNPNTRITFEVGGTAGRLHDVLVEIYTLQGRRVKTLLDTELPPGPHQVVWHAKSASGVYFARVSVDGIAKTTKLTLAK